MSIEDKIYKSLLKPGYSREQKAVMVSGQPGAGKSSLQRKFAEEQKAVVVNGDEYRRYHPGYEELKKQYKNDVVYHTAEFAGKMTEEMIGRFSSENYNLVIEGTLRKKEVVSQTCKSLKEKGYQVELEVIAAKPEISYESTKLRYESMKALGLEARVTPKEIHDEAVKNILENVESLYQEKLFDNIVVWNRENQVLYNQKETPEQSPRPVMEKALHGAWQENELKQWHAILDETCWKKKENQAEDWEAYKEYADRTKAEITKCAIRAAGYKPTQKLLRDMEQLQVQTGRLVTVKELKEMYQNQKDLTPELKAVVNQAAKDFAAAEKVQKRPVPMPEP